MNPKVQETVYSLLRNHDNIHLIPPLDYAPFVYAMARCKFILTDSGGVQEEAPLLGKHVLVMRDTTERPEALTAGTVNLVGTDTKRIILEAEKLLKQSGKVLLTLQFITPMVMATLQKGSSKLYAFFMISKIFDR